MVVAYRKATARHGCWLEATTSSLTTFPHFVDLPFEIQTQIWEYASIPECNQAILHTLDLSFNQQTENWGHADAFERNNTAYFFSGELRLSPALLRGLETVMVHQSEVYPTLYSALWRRVSISWQYDLSRSLAQTCRLSRWTALRHWKEQIRSIEEEDGGTTAIKDIKMGLLSELYELIDDVHGKINTPVGSIAGEAALY